MGDFAPLIRIPWLAGRSPRKIFPRQNAMKTIGTFCFISGFLGTAAFAQRAQNTDISFLFGAVGTSGSSGSTTTSTILSGASGPIPVEVPVVTGTFGFAMQANFGYQMKSFSKGSLYVEVPFIFEWSGSGAVAGVAGNPSVTSIDHSSSYILPGVRWRIPTGTRFSFYAALGGGVAFIHEEDVFLANQQVTTTNQTLEKPVLDFGIGMDVRISRWLSLRVDARDYVHSSASDVPQHYNHAAVFAGFAFHF
jgi:hypothetical protein